MSKNKEPMKPTSKASYAMPKTQTSNRFEVLGKTLHPSFQTPQKFAYQTKENRLLLQILEPDHISVSGEIQTSKIFQNEKYFISTVNIKNLSRVIVRRRCYTRGFLLKHHCSVFRRLLVSRLIYYLSLKLF